MRRIITPFVLAMGFSSFAQISITNSDMPSANDTFRLSTTTDLWGIDPSLTGTNYTWNFAFLAWATQDVDTCVSVSSTPFAYQFFFNNAILYPNHKADYAIRGQDFSILSVFTMTDVYDFYRKDATGFKGVGFGANINGLPASVKNDPVDLVYKMPLNFNDTYNSYSEYELSIPGMFTYGQKKWRDATVDGWGTLTTPYGTFQTLRVKFLVDITDSLVIDSLGISQVFPRPTETQYHWLANGHDVPLLQINETAGFITGIIYKDSATTSGLGIVQPTLRNSLGLYPNPAEDYFYVSSRQQEISNIAVMDISGRILTEIKTLSGNYSVRVPCASMDCGVYIVRVALYDGTVTENRLVIK